MQWEVTGLVKVVLELSVKLPLQVREVVLPMAWHLKEEIYLELQQVQLQVKLQTCSKQEPLNLEVHKPKIQGFSSSVQCLSLEVWVELDLSSGVLLVLEVMILTQTSLWT